MIIKLHGTSGSGKTTAVRGVMALGTLTVVEHNVTRPATPPLVYRVDAGRDTPLFVFGNYETVCGGCDTILDYKTVLPVLLERYAPKGHVLLEGMLLSGAIGVVGEKLEELDQRGQEVVYAFMDTPLNVCLARVGGRRLARGKMEPLNPHNTTGKFGQTQRMIVRLREMRRRVVIVNHKDPVTALVALLSDARQGVKVVGDRTG